MKIVCQSVSDLHNEKGLLWLKNQTNQTGNERGNSISTNTTHSNKKDNITDGLFVVDTMSLNRKEERKTQ